VRDPKVFLFDEPLSNLDAALRVSTRGEISALHRRLGATMIYVTHDQVEAMTMGTRICIMNGGRVAQVGPPLEVYRHPANIFVASFLGNPPMTLLPAVATDKSSGRCLKVGYCEIELPPNRCPQLQPGSQVTFGIRPEHVAQSSVANGAAAPIEAEIIRVEPLGAETIVIARLPGVEKLAFARLPGDAVFSIGERRQLFLDTGMAHVFGSDGLALRPT